MTATGSTAEKTSVGEGLFGCALILAFGIYLTWPIFDKGRPASLLCIGLFVLSRILHVVAEAIKGPDRKKRGKDAPQPPSPKHDLVARIASGLVTGTQKAAFWTAVGMALVWLLQLFLNFRPEQIDPDQAAGLQLWAYDSAHGLKDALTPQIFVVVIFALLALSTAVGSLWPVNVAGRLKKWAGIAASALIAFSSMTFVTAQSGGDRFDASVDVIRAAIGADLDRLREARQEKAALQWLGASLERVKDSPEDASAWRSYLGTASKYCKAAEVEFETGFGSDAAAPAGPNELYCNPAPYAARLAAEQVEGAVSGGPQAKSSWAWVPEWNALRGSDQSMSPVIRQAPRHIADLQALAKRVKIAADNEEAARNQVESAVVALTTTVFPDATVGAIEEFVKSLKQTVIEAIYRDSRDRVAMWLQLRNIKVPRPIEAVLGIEPQLRLVSPAAQIRRAGGVEALARTIWKRDHPESLETVRNKGREQAESQREFEDFVRGVEVAPDRPGRDNPTEPVRPRPRPRAPVR